MAKKPKTNWDRISAQDPQSKFQYRDVYEDQQLERSKIAEKQSPTSRIVAAVAAAILVFVLVYVVMSMASGFISMISGTSTSTGTETVQEEEVVDDALGPDWVQPAYEETVDPMTGMCWMDEYGQVFDHEPTRADYLELYYQEHPEERPAETEEETVSSDAEISGTADGSVGFSFSIGAAFRPTFMKIFISFMAGFMTFGILYQVLMRNLEAQNMMADTADINQYPNDQHIALPEEIQRKFDWFPDVGAHSPVQVSSMISHMALSNKGLKKVKLARRAEKDILDEDGDVLFRKDEILTDENGDVIYDTVPMIDEKFMDALFDASGALDDKRVRKRYDATAIPYNGDGKSRTKQGGKYDTVADMINGAWTFPEYEPQRPAGAYLVDTEPVNTMVLAITRAGGF